MGADDFYNAWIGYANRAIKNVFQYYKDLLGLEENESAVLGDFLSGDCHYLYYAYDGADPERIDAAFTLSTASNVVIVDSPYIYVSGRADGITLPVAGLQVVEAYNYNDPFVCSINTHPFRQSSFRIDPRYETTYWYTDSTTLRQPAFTYDGAIVTNNQNYVTENTVYINVNNTDSYTFNDIRVQVINYVNLQLPEGETVNPSDIDNWNDLDTETETESETETETGSGCGCDCTTIYVNADGSLTLNNDISGDMPITFDNNADLSLNINATAGAFGAGAVVIDPNANINLGAGAIGAGAIVNPELNVSGNVEVSEISGELNINTSEIVFSGGNVTVDQSGATNSNTYNITNNYYYDPSEPTEPDEEPFTVDYDEILSEDEFESVLTQETYYIPEYETEFFKETETVLIPYDDVVATELEEAPNFVADSVSVGWNVLQDWGVSGFFVNCATVCAIWKVIVGR